MKNFIILASITLFSFTSQANTAYISPDGSGNGYTSNSPASISNLNNLLSDSSLDKINLLPGNYSQTDALILNQGDHPIEVVGVNNVTFSSNYNFYSGSNSGFVIARSNISFKNLSFLNTRYCFRFKNNNVENVNIENINAYNNSSCIEFDSNIEKHVSNISINNLKSMGYYKAGIRIDGSDTHNVSISNTILDGLATSTESERDCFISGILINGYSKDILIDNVSISNNIGGIEGCRSYQQGDGIVSNKNTSNIVINNTVISNSRDADLDLKGKNITLNKIKSLSGNEARYNLKLWDNEFTCTECYINTANVSALIAFDSQITLVDSTIKVDESARLCDIRFLNTSTTAIDFINTNFPYHGDIVYQPSNLAQCE